MTVLATAVRTCLSPHVLCALVEIFGAGRGYRFEFHPNGAHKEPHHVDQPAGRAASV
jgi:hypothetical protein